MNGVNRVPLSVRVEGLRAALKHRGFKLAKRTYRHEYRIIDRAENFIVAPMNTAGWMTVDEVERWLDERLAS